MKNKVNILTLTYFVHFFVQIARIIYIYIYITFNIPVYCYYIQVIEFLDNLSFLISNLLNDMRICSLHDKPFVY